MFFVYQIILSFLLLISPLIIFYRVIKKKEEKKIYRKIQFSNQKKTVGKLIWFHGASVGEILSIIPIIKYYERKKYNQILITSST